ncbi:MAG: hypothetical protein QF460_01350 [Candidatus Nanoarchaeia archaeon]|mgnify:CR=1 FL=1|nr:hypothetical protein [Candidatus Nanoarchaeia archaeon]
MAKRTSKKKPVEKEQSMEELFSDLDFTDDEMVVAQKIAAEFMRQDDPEQYEEVSKEKDGKVFKDILVDLFNFGKKRELRHKLEQIEKLVKEAQELM